ncbi:tyrosine-protein kinase receptor UFO isoform X2 [Ctenopharyngodon idella]|uniref:tyrosine-protein kinase receptor UFO isoform X2 n=1 Tax=Ctenopharyngodon idella TaxID=7959 RepID=UPI0022318A57|nr:tyrosine-protein kinase receptor UFO isoform X2 [Ctenopharyngodon idella]
MWIPIDVSGSVQTLEGMSDMLCGLKDVLVERTTLKMCRMLGKGEFGAVYEGIFSPQRGQDIRVAVKTSKEAIHNKEDLESFLKEAEIMKHFNHPNVVKLLGVVLERNPESSIILPLVILPYMKHRDLHSFLKATRLGDVPMWSFGITMWEITSRGKLPYPGVSNHELLDLLEKGHRLRQGDNDSKLYEVMLSCWHRDPSQRSDFGELGQSLKALLSELPPLEANKEAHYICLGLEAASDHQDSAEALEPEVEGML